jgi:two-component system, cell cycle response regulator
VSASPATVWVTRLPGWGWYLCGGAVLVGVYFLLAVIDGAGTVKVAVYGAISLSAPVAVLVGVRRHSPRRRLPWYLVGGGQAAYGIGDVAFYLQRLVAGVDAGPVADLCYLASYPMTAAGLALFIRQRTGGRDLASLIDTAIFGLGVGLAMWVYLLAPQLAGTTQSLPVEMTAVAYAVMDLLVGTLAIRMALGCTDVTATHRLLYGWAGGLFTADIAFGYLQLTGGYDPGGVLDLLWLTSALALGAAALHPSMRVLDQSAPAPEPIIGFGRLSALAVTCLAAPALLYLEYLQRAPLHVPLIAAASAGLFLLALARMKVLADGQRHAAITDSLTGLRTRRFLQEAMLRQVGPGTGLLLLDVDHFKKINDGYGHGAGDEVLVELARRLLATVRRGDVVARYGGEEFAVLLPRTDVAEMAASAERIRQSIAATPMSGAGRLLSVTVSVGGAALRPGQSIDEWIADADRALYAAKDAGRNRVVTPALARATHLPVDVWAA